MKYPMLVLILVVLMGCSGKLTVIDIGLEGEAEAGKEGTSGRVINFLVFYTPGSTLSTVTEQTTDGQVPISLYGANSATGSQDNPNAVFNPVSIVKEVIETVAPVVPENVEVLDSDEFAPMTFDMVPYKNKTMAWLPGISYQTTTGPLTFAFDGGCGVLEVPDAKHIYAPDGNLSNHNQRYYFSGDPSEQKGFHSPGSPDASVMTKPGCAATTVTVTRG